MNDRRLLLLCLSLLAAAGLAACRADPGPPPLQGARMGGPFTLTSHEGRRVSSDQFAGKYRIVYFGYTFCPDVCPVDLQLITAALRQFEESDPARAARVQPIFITTDPARDTPAVLADYKSSFHPRLVALTGSPQEIGNVARAHGVYFEAREPAAGAAQYLVDHNRLAVLYGPDGQPIAILPHDQGPAGVLEALERWVQ
ncbi:MAG TPA: SCO family protein [Allosphingosinicella sp.]|jgi:protein SCO1/2